MLKPLAVIWLIWGLNWVVMKSANAYFPPILFVAWRFGSGALILAAVAWWKKIPLPDAKTLPWIILSGLLQLTINNVTAQVGMQSVSAGMAAVLNYTAPLWTAILAHFALNEQLTRMKLFGVLLAIAGLYVLMGLQGVGDLGAAFLIISGAICMAISNIIVKLRLTKCNMLQLTTWQMIFGATTLVIYTTLVPQGEIDWCAEAVLCLAYNGAMASALAFFLWNYVLTRIEASKASIATLVAPIVGVLGGVAILNEPFTAYIVLGIVLIFAGILIVVTKKS